MSQGRNWNAVVKSFFATVTTLSVLYTFFVVGPIVEKTWFPVLTKMQMIKVESLTEETSAVWTEFEKLRECEYIGTAWYRSPAMGPFERVSMVPIRDPDDTSSPERMTGKHKAGPWRITIPASEVRTRSFVQVYHRCHPFWTTTSQFYP